MTHTPLSPSPAADLIRRVQAEDIQRAYALLRVAVGKAQDDWVPADCILAALLLLAQDLRGRTLNSPTDLDPEFIGSRQ